ncbi:heme A synthase [soil metagenome]
MRQNHKKEDLFSKIGFITIVAVYFLILVGGIVRSTGSGMGCPDWPKCFGNWVPPTEEAQLPEDYKNVYAQKRLEKNSRLANNLEVLGFEKLAFEIRNEASIQEETEFNSTKTWIEYLNRLVGAVIGLLILATLLASVKFLKKKKNVFYLSLFLFILVMFQGWLGSLVVSTNLLPWMVTVHMLVALLMIGLLILLVFIGSGGRGLEVKMSAHKFNLNFLLILCAISLVVQTVLGTQVREAIDQIAVSFQFLNRGEWISNLDYSFYIHRSFSLAILLLHIYLVYYLYRNGFNSNKILNLSKFLLLLIVLEIISGIVMAYFAIPPFIQPVHLLLATLIFGLQFYMILIINAPVTEQETKFQKVKKFDLAKV